MLAGFTADREFHPAPKVEYFVAFIDTLTFCFWDAENADERGFF